MLLKVVHLQQLWGNSAENAFDVSVADVPDLFRQVKDRTGKNTLVWRDPDNVPHLLSERTSNLPEGTIYFTGGRSRRGSRRSVRRASRRSSRRGSRRSSRRR